MNTHNPPKDGRPLEEPVEVEADIEDQAEAKVFAVPGGAGFVDAVRAKLGLDAEVHLFERDHDEPLTALPAGRKAIHIVGHRCGQVVVEVHYEHLTKSEKFPPSATAFKVLRWAVSKRGFNLDPMQAAKANLILPGAKEPLPRDAAIGKFVKPGHCVLVVNLTLEDFSNG